MTGSSRGIGKALARGLLAAGAEVVLNARGAEQLEAVHAELRAAAPGRVRALAFDVTDEEQVRRGVAEAGHRALRGHQGEH